MDRRITPAILEKAIMNAENFPPPHCVKTECSPASRAAATTDDLLSVIVLFDYPFDAVSLDEALFELGDAGSSMS